MMDLDGLWIIICAIMVVEMQAGFLCLESGFVRAKNAINVALKNVTDLCLVSLVYWAVGFGVMFGPSVGGLFGAHGFFFAGDLGPEGGPVDYAKFFFQLAFAGTAVTIISGAISERAAFAGYLGVTMVVATVIYPVAGHWAWGGVFAAEGAPWGWLQAMGFIDFAGSTVVHGVGGWVALAYIIVLGPRLGRFSRKRRLFEPSNLSLAALGVLFLWIGWSGFNAGSTLSFSGAVPEILVNTTLAAAAGGAASLFVAWRLYGLPHVGSLLNGVVAGLVAVTASCHIVAPPLAALVGAVGGLSMLAASYALERLRLDDAVGAVPVHLVAGVWGTLAVALFGDSEAFESGSRLAQLGVQLLGVAVIGGWSFGLGMATLLVVNRLTPLRVGRVAERDGLNVAEHGVISALHELSQEMARHRRAGMFSRPATVEPGTEAGLVACHYNRVMERVAHEITYREAITDEERRARQEIEAARLALIEARRESDWAARHDALTGLANRRFLEEMLESIACEDGERWRRELIVYCLDLDRFKTVNDLYGHPAGDAVLRRVSRVLAATLSENEFAARTGGDEFVIIATARGDDVEAEAAALAQTLLEDLNQPTKFEGSLLYTGASIGFALAADGAEDPHELMTHADLALCEAKQSGRRRSLRFTPDLGARAAERGQLAEALKRAIDNDEIEPFFQPQFCAETRRIAGFEALARWRQPTGRVLSPAIFLDIADELNLTATLDRIIFDKAIDAFLEWRAAGLEAPRLSVNVSANRLRSDTLIREIESRTDIPYGALAFEVLETVFIDTADATLSWNIDQLKERGVQIEVDDFGTGHASVASVVALQPDRVKLDRMFVTDIEHDPQRRTLAQSMVALARGMGVSVTAEGVETDAQLEILREIGCAEAQGYGLAAPMTADDVRHWLEARRRFAEAARRAKYNSRAAAPV